VALQRKEEKQLLEAPSDVAGKIVFVCWGPGCILLLKVMDPESVSQVQGAVGPIFNELISDI
jgi:hypothetical protein